MSTFSTEIVLGEKYRDKSTEFVGTALSVHFYQNGCERVVLSAMDNFGAITSPSFDAPDLIHVESNKPVELLERKTGGPHDHRYESGIGRD